MDGDLLGELLRVTAGSNSSAGCSVSVCVSSAYCMNWSTARTPYSSNGYAPAWPSIQRNWAGPLDSVGFVMPT